MMDIKIMGFINDVGQTVGEYKTSSGNQTSFIYSGGAITKTLSTGTANTQAYGINNAGQVVGDDGPTGNITYGFIYNGGNFTNFSAKSGAPITVAIGINSTGQIVGYGGGVVSPGGVVGPYEGFLYLGSIVEVLKVPGATTTVAQGINSTGEIVGYWEDSGPTRTSGFIYKNGVYTVVNVPGSTSIRTTTPFTTSYTKTEITTRSPFFWGASGSGSGNFWGGERH
jgi:hypothetical protein